ncbi:hypothetical protein [Notoacmeibacter ruber]|uniref:Uncharacterized protein n=1 Tax=Notoacmeibacter ruber TaxID=2670375 RepID=A0A3L7JEI5_9HYPH|nr:hypothetical protein [Notoacmeibacter ruber]RLQ87981.1 hypothetical protein D8780_06925 [Notoacmeibacter ruber]
MTDAAKDLWGQIFSRALELPDAAINRPENEGEQAQRFREALRAAGWSDEKINARYEAYAQLEQPLQPTSPGVAPNLEAHAQIIADRVSAAITAQGLAHTPVLVGIDPRPGVEAGLTNVIMTDEAILTVTSFFFRWCGLIARAYTRTLLLDPKYWSTSELSPEEDRLLLLRDIELTLYWNRIFVSFASTGTHALVPYRPATEMELFLFEQVAWATEYFAFAHEYGHHALVHRNVGDNPIKQEYAADSFAMSLAEQLRSEPLQIDNPYIATGAGGVLVLMANDILRSIDTKDAPAPTNGAVLTHPVTSERVSRITNRHLMQPDRFRFDREFCNTVARIMNVVAGIVREFHDSGGRELIDKIRSST